MTSASAQASATPPEVKNLIQTAIDTIRHTREDVQKRRAEILSVQNRIAQQDARVDDALTGVGQARDEAIKDAKVQAQELATSAGVTLGTLQTINFNDNMPSPLVESFGKGGGGLAAADVAVPINPGTMTLTVTVSMAYEIK